jgi:hypothetical protein
MKAKLLSRSAVVYEYLTFSGGMHEFYEILPWDPLLPIRSFLILRNYLVHQLFQNNVESSFNETKENEPSGKCSTALNSACITRQELHVLKNL